MRPDKPSNRTVISPLEWPKSYFRCKICRPGRWPKSASSPAVQTFATSQTPYVRCGLNVRSARIGSYFFIYGRSPEPVGYGQRTVRRHDEHVDERRNANNQEAEQKCGNESCGSHWPG